MTCAVHMFGFPTNHTAYKKKQHEHTILPQSMSPRSTVPSKSPQGSLDDSDSMSPTARRAELPHSRAHGASCSICSVCRGVEAPISVCWASRLTTMDDSSPMGWNGLVVISVVVGFVCKCQVAFSFVFMCSTSKSSCCSKPSFLLGSRGARHLSLPSDSELLQNASSIYIYMCICIICIYITTKLISIYIYTPAPPKGLLLDGK